VGDVPTFLKLENKLLKHTGNVLYHVIVPEADDTIAARLEPARARLTVVRMLSAVDLDDELRLGSERMLTAESETFEPFLPQA